MEIYLTNKVKTKIKGLAYYQIAGGIIGVGSTILLIGHSSKIIGLVVLVFTLVAGLYLFSIYCGQQLLKGNIKIGLKLSKINQVLQIINIAMLGYAYKYNSGLLLSIGIDWTSDFNFTFEGNIGSAFQFNSINKDLLTVAINLVAIFLFYFIDNLQDQIEVTDNSLTPLNIPEVAKF